MRSLSIDIETYSSNDLIKSGVYKYVEAADFAILLFAYAFDDNEVEIVDLTAEELPDVVFHALTDPAIIKTAHNANFERTCIRQYFSIDLPVNQWECTMVRASMLGLPLSLGAAGRALKLEAEKSSSGKALIKYFTVPCKPTKANGGRVRNLPQHDPEKWQQFKDYCVQDVVVERSIRNKTLFFQIPAMEKRVWQIDQMINDRGIMVDLEFVKNAISIDSSVRAELIEQAVEITKLENPNSTEQLKKWLSSEGLETDTLRKTDIPELLNHTSSDNVKKVLIIRQQMSKSSIKKYGTMLASVCRDQRVRGLVQYYGAGRTGRWAGRLIQVQNLPRISIEDLDTARTCVKLNAGDDLDMLFGNVPLVLSELIRTSFVAPPGHRFIIADFSAIEARIIAWLAGEKWRLDVFNTHGKIYEASASAMFNLPIDSIGKNSPDRQKGKIAELSLGFQGSADALARMDLQEANKDNYKNWYKGQLGIAPQRLNEDELPEIVARWRKANRKIVQLWYAVNDAAISAVKGEPVTIKHGIKFYMEKGILFIKLPSGRALTYLRPRIRVSDFGESIWYEGMNQTTKQWGLQQTYGGKLVENIVQGTARDCLADAMIRLTDADYKIAMHVHDEFVLDEPEGKGSVEEVDRIMSSDIPWAKGLPLKAESYETYYYKKD